MLARVWSGAVRGVHALPIEIECHIESGLPRYTVVGLPDNAVRESRDRIWSALKNSGLPLPRGGITVNMAPADVRKEGSAYDLPLAIGLLAAGPLKHVVQHGKLDDYWLVGELSLDGTVRPVRGVLPVAVQALQEGRKGMLVPLENAAEASVVEGLRVLGVRSLPEAVEWFTGEQELEPYRQDLQALFQQARRYELDFSEVRGQDSVKRAMEVAAAGGHNVLMVGPPGAGKTMLARRLPGILPPLSLEEALETTKIHSVGGKLAPRSGLVAVRPFRAPHHTISDVGLCGGGSNPLPGEISLAHNGVLFLDELPEFRRSVLEVLRQPLEEGRITISRARFSVDYPARFMLVASMNPCPCGYLNDPVRTCVCTPVQVQRYLSRISGPLLDRIDLHIEVTPVPFEELSQHGRKGESSAHIRERVVRARERQKERFAGIPGVYTNAQMGARHVEQFCRLDAAGKQLMKMAMQRLGLSARAYSRIRKVARTIADLAGSEHIGPEHLSEAIQYRSLDREWWVG